MVDRLEDAPRVPTLREVDAGLPAEVLDGLSSERRLRLPMREGNRSLNLSNAAAVVVYEAWRQLGFDGGA